VIDPDKLLGAPLPDRTLAWTVRDVILYGLGLGVGDAGIGPRDLERIYERDLHVLPTFGALGMMVDIDEVVGLPGAGFDPALLLHGSHELSLERPLPSVVADARRVGSVVGVHEKGANATVVIDSLVETADGVLATSRNTLFVRGEGGFGGSYGVVADGAPAVPDRAPDHVSDVPVRANLAALYRLSGDWNILHIDPEVSGAVGFPVPILQGMCSLGIAVVATVDAELDGDTTAVRRVCVRFAGVALPGDVLQVRTWRSDAGAAFDVVAANRDGAPVLSNGCVEV
jgi:acyl dehydratase